MNFTTFFPSYNKYTVNKFKILSALERKVRVEQLY